MIWRGKNEKDWIFNDGFIGNACIAGCRLWRFTGSSQEGRNGKVLRVGTEPAFAPFEFQKEGSDEFTGFDMDLIRAIGTKLGYKVEISSMGFDALIPALNSGNIDVAIAGMSITDERKKVVVFSDPYYTSGLIVMVKKMMIQSKASVIWKENELLCRSVPQELIKQAKLKMPR